MKIKFIKYIFFCFILFLVGCENDEEFQKIDKDNIIKQSQQANLSISKDDLGLFPFEKITVYCTHNTEKPVLEIKNIFEQETYCEVQVNVAKQEKINDYLDKTKYGEIIITETEEDLKNITTNIEYSNSIAKHTPVLVTQKNDFQNVSTLEELTKQEVNFLTVNVKTGLGLSSLEFFKNYYKKYYDKNKFEYIGDFENDKINSFIEKYKNGVAINWKESVDTTIFNIIEIEELKNFSANVMAGKFKQSFDNDVANEFMKFLNSNDSKNIFQKYGYEVD